MSNLSSTRGTDIPFIDNTTVAAGNTAANASSFRVSPETYTTLDNLVKTTKDFHMDQLVETYGDQGITGFLKLTGAINSGGSSDEINWWEIGRRHETISYTTATIDSSGDDFVQLDDTDSGLNDKLQVNDVVMDADTGVRFIVIEGGTLDTEPATFGRIKLNKLDQTDVAASDITASNGTLLKIGNLYAQGTAQPHAYQDMGIRKYTNPFMIVKDRYEVSGSQATNIGWVNLGGGNYRWYLKGEQEARKRFEDKREMMLLFGEKKASSGLSDAPLTDRTGSEGYFSAIEDRGVVVQNASANPMDSFAEFDDLIIELDKQGAPSEYAMYVNRAQDLAIDDMLASGISTGVTAGLAGQFGAFNNDADMAVKLGFKSFTRGGYTFHKHDWKLLNDPTLLGASNYVQGAMVPLTQVTDARSGVNVPALAMFYKEANGYSREMEHWVSGGGVLGHTNNGDAGKDQAVFHYRSEVALCTRAANQHVMIKG